MKNLEIIDTTKPTDEQLYQIDYLKSLAIQIPIWIEKGNELIIPGKEKDWYNNIIRSSQDVKDCGHIINTSIQIMEMLNDDKSFEEIKCFVDNLNYHQLTLIDIHFTVLYYHSKGPEYILNICDIENQKYWYDEINKVEAKNFELGCYKKKIM